MLRLKRLVVSQLLVFVAHKARSLQQMCWVQNLGAWSNFSYLVNNEPPFTLLWNSKNKLYSTRRDGINAD
jgi:hypothetical protein